MSDYEAGFYWVKWEPGDAWEPAQWWTGKPGLGPEWLRIDSTNWGDIPAVIGERILPPR